MSAAFDNELACSDLESLRHVADAPAPIDKPRALARVRAMLAPDTPQRPEYPIQALGPLAGACSAIADHGQVQPAMAGQCLLAAASLLTHGLWNVQSMSGVKPLSLYALTLGDSGDGKSTAQEAALRPVNVWQRAAAKAYADGLADYERAMSTKKRGTEAPEPPAVPYRLVGDATVEGLRRDLAQGPCAQGVFSDEAAAILSGYGMSQDHRAKTAGVFSKLWDAGHLSVSRAVGGRVERYGRRIALHWLIQPMAASESMSDPLLSHLGFWPRFLLAWPEPGAPRVARPIRWDTLPDVGRYWQRCNELLAEPLPEDATECPTIVMDAAAQRLVSEAFERFEKQAKARGGELRAIKPFALRATEQVCRVAGVLAAFAGRVCIGIDEARGALALVVYSLESWRLVVERGITNPSTENAARLYEWLLQQPGHAATGRDISRNAVPHTLRGKDTRDAAIDALEAYALIERDGSKVVALPPPDGETDGRA